MDSRHGGCKPPACIQRTNVSHNTFKGAQAEFHDPKTGQIDARTVDFDVDLQVIPEGTQTANTWFMGCPASLHPQQAVSTWSSGKIAQNLINADVGCRYGLFGFRIGGCP